MFIYLFLIVIYVLFCVFCIIVLYCVLFVCKCVPYYCHRVSTKLELTKYSVLQKDRLNFISLSFKIRTSDKYDMAWTVNGASTLASQLVAVFQVLCSLYGLTCVGYAQNFLEFVSRSPPIHVVGRSFAFTQTAYLLKLVIPTTNAPPRWRLNVETKTKRTLHSSRRLSFNELTNAKKLVLPSSHFALNWRCCTAVG